MGKYAPNRYYSEIEGVLILVLVDLGGKVSEIKAAATPEVLVLILVLVDLGGKVCVMNAIVDVERLVLILVLVDLGGKELPRLKRKPKGKTRLNPCFGGFGWERPLTVQQTGRQTAS